MTGGDKKRCSGWLARMERFANRLVVRASVRTATVLLAGTVLANGLFAAGYFDRDKVAGTVAGYVGFSAQNIRISGLKNQHAEAVLAAIGVRPGASLLGFDPARARQTLENIDWVRSASVQRIYPNQLIIDVDEREPFAVWQRDGQFYVIDNTGAAISSLDVAQMPKLLMVTGEGAHKAVFSLVNHLEALDGLSSRVKAAARVGNRRWTLYLASGMKVALPEHEMEKALITLMQLEKRHKVFSKAITMIDLRIAGRVTFKKLPVKKQSDGPVRVSRAQQ